MFCPVCGSHLDDSSKSCIYCGANLEAKQPAAPFAETETQVYSQYAASADQNFTSADSAESSYILPNTTPAKKKGGAVKIIIPIVAVIVAAAIAVSCFMMFGNKKYYLSTQTLYAYDEDGNTTGTSKMAYYGKFMLPLEMTMEGEDYSYSLQFAVDKKDRLIECKMEEGDEGFSIDIEYEKKNGKQIGTGSCKEDDVKHEIEVVYESKDEFTVKLESDGESTMEFDCYIDDDGYSVTEWLLSGQKMIYVYDGVNLIEQKIYVEADGKSELYSSIENTYNKDGFLIESVSENNVSSNKSKTVYERNKNNVPTSIEWYEDGEKVKYAEIDEEDKDKVVLEIFDADDETIGSIEYGLDGKKITYEKEFDADGELTSEKTYNEKGLLTETITYSDGKKTQKIVCEYEKR